MTRYTIHDQRERRDGLSERGFAVAESGFELAEFPGRDEAARCRAALECGISQADAIRQAGPTVDALTYRYTGKASAMVDGKPHQVDAGAWRTAAEVTDATKAALAEAKASGTDAYAFVELTKFHHGVQVSYDVVQIH